MTPLRRAIFFGCLGVLLASRIGCVPPSIVDPASPAPSQKVTAAVYVFEKDYGLPPASVQAALDKLNAGGIVATTFEQDTRDGTGEVPKQYQAPLAAAKSAGFPSERVPAVLVVMASDKAIKAVQKPTTEDSVLEAVK